MNIVQKIKDIAQKHPYQKAVIFPQGQDSRGRALYSHYTYKKLDQESDFLAAQLLNLGIKPGTKTIMFVKASLEFSLITFALFKIGAIPILIDPGMGRKNLLNAIKSAKPDAMIAVPEIFLAKLIFRNKFSSIKISVSTGSFRIPGTFNLNRLLPPSNWNEPCPFPVYEPKAKDTAAILFTSGGTGTPKGVIYTHDMFLYQAEAIKNMFSLDRHDKDLAGFPLFSMLTMAIGVSSYIPDMNPSRPATANPRKLVQNIIDHGITTVNGSPAIWEKVALYCREKQIQLPSVRSVMMYGAPVRDHIHELFKEVIPNGKTYSPYGATECLPISCMSGDEFLQTMNQYDYKSLGICVGQVLDGLEVNILKENDGQQLCEALEIGEIVVSGPQVSQSYLDNKSANARSKFRDEDGKLWHRMGDMGFKDHNGLLWFSGRKAHKVDAKNNECFYSVPVEYVFNQHKSVKRTALIAIRDEHNRAKPALAVERIDKKTKLASEDDQQFLAELRQLGQENPSSANISDFFLHANFPVDPRHNIKIDRLALSKFFTSVSENDS